VRVQRRYNHGMVELWSHAVDWLNASALTPFVTLIPPNRLAGDWREMAEALLIVLLQVAAIRLAFRPPHNALAPAQPRKHPRYARIDCSCTQVMLNLLFACERCLVAMQWDALRRVRGVLWTPARWHLGELAFDPYNRPIATAHVDLPWFDREPARESLEGTAVG